MKYRVLDNGEFVGYIVYDRMSDQYVFSNTLLSPHPDLSLNCKYFDTVLGYNLWLGQQFEDYYLVEEE